jgi:ring-1,2-phenylacetyl-CoA epoxidase subunit PaaB
MSLWIAKDTKGYEKHEIWHSARPFRVFRSLSRLSWSKSFGRGSMRQWHFDPYHQRIDEALEATQTPPAADTEWPIWEVFQQARRGEHHQHVGSVHAPNAEMALLLAKENFVRRGPCANLWVAPASAIYATTYDDADLFERTTDKSYRETVGYRGFRQKRVAKMKDEG